DPKAFKSQEKSCEFFIEEATCFALKKRLNMSLSISNESKNTLFLFRMPSEAQQLFINKFPKVGAKALEYEDIQKSSDKASTLHPRAIQGRLSQSMDQGVKNRWEIFKIGRTFTPFQPERSDAELTTEFGQLKKTRDSLYETPAFKRASHLAQ